MQQPIIDPDHVLTFGKHRDLTVEYILLNYRKYFKWLEEKEIVKLTMKQKRIILSKQWSNTL